MTGFGAFVLGLLPVLVTEVNLTVQVPTGNVDDPVHVPDSGGSTVDIGTVRVMEPFDATALTLVAVSVALPRNSTENVKTVAVVPDSGATAPWMSLVGGAPTTVTAGPSERTRAPIAAAQAVRARGFIGPPR